MGEAVRKNHIVTLREQFEALMNVFGRKRGRHSKNLQDFGVLKLLLPLPYAWRKRRPKV